jgi:hypothetical protein
VETWRKVLAKVASVRPEEARILSSIGEAYHGGGRPGSRCSRGTA